MKLFLAVLMFIWAGLAGISGALGVIWGAYLHGAPIVASGIFWLVYAVLLAVGGFLLGSYCSRLAGIGRDKSPVRLAAALAALKNFWLFVSIVTIVFLAFAAVAVIWVVAIVLAPPTF